MLTLLTWLSHSTFKIQTPDQAANVNRTIYIDPWRDSPLFPESEKNIEKADLILVTHGHFDHCLDAPAISDLTDALVICSWDLMPMMQAMGAQSVYGINKGGFIDLGWVKVQMVSADHSGTYFPGGFFGGFPTGFVIEFRDGSPKLYHAGDTNVFSDMRIISDLYKPEVALLPIGGRYGMGPKEAAYALNEFLDSVKTVVPMHYGTFSIIPGTPEELIESLKSTPRHGPRAKVKVLEIGTTYRLSSLV